MRAFSTMWLAFPGTKSYTVFTEASKLGGVSLEITCWCLFSRCNEAIHRPSLCPFPSPKTGSESGRHPWIIDMSRSDDDDDDDAYQSGSFHDARRNLGFFGPPMTSLSETALNT